MSKSETLREAARRLARAVLDYNAEGGSGWWSNALSAAHSVNDMCAVSGEGEPACEAAMRRMRVQMAHDLAHSRFQEREVLARWVAAYPLLMKYSDAPEDNEGEGA